MFSLSIYVVLPIVILISSCQSRRSLSELHVVNGDEVSRSDVFASNVGFLSANSGRCTATALTPWVVITAQHCINLPAIRPVQFKTLDQQSVYLDTSNAIFFKSGSMTPDIALIPTLKPLILSQNILISDLDTLPKELVVYGGSNNNSAINSSIKAPSYVMRKAKMQVRRTVENRSHYNNVAERPADYVSRMNDLSASSNVSELKLDRNFFKSAGICQGDSGGPSFVIGNDKSSKIIGVHSNINVSTEVKLCKREIKLARSWIDPLGYLLSFKFKNQDSNSNASKPDEDFPYMCGDFSLDATGAAGGGTAIIIDKMSATHLKKMGKNCLDVSPFYNSKVDDNIPVPIDWYLPPTRSEETGDELCPPSSRYLTFDEAKKFYDGIGLSLSGGYPFSVAFFDDTQKKLRALIGPPAFASINSVDYWCEASEINSDTYLPALAPDLRKLTQEMEDKAKTLNGSLLTINVQAYPYFRFRPGMTVDQLKVRAIELLDKYRNQFKEDEAKNILSELNANSFTTVLNFPGVEDSSGFSLDYSSLWTLAIEQKPNPAKDFQLDGRDYEFKIWKQISLEPGEHLLSINPNLSDVGFVEPAKSTANDLYNEPLQSPKIECTLLKQFGTVNICSKIKVIVPQNEQSGRTFSFLNLQLKVISSVN